ncbi:AMP-binding protein [Streptomyces sp. NPDC001194]|uniref:AMP-binding protein n=1 Tax=Streptomyces sp. NPDC001194 TaxID=3364547 RepID=UPI00368B199B
MNQVTEPALYARFLRGLALSPRGTAIRVGAEEVSYEELHERALLWAGALLASDAEPPKAVGVLADKGIESYVGLLAGLYTGATVVPLHAEFPAARTRYMLEASGVRSVIADRRGLAALESAAPQGSRLSVLAPGVADGGSDTLRTLALDPGRALHEPLRVKEQDEALILFTSGSTGRPKGVPITHGSFHHYFQVLDGRYDFRPDDVFSQSFDLNFDCAMFDLFCAWGAGASAHAIPPAAYRDMPAFFADRRMTVWFSTPSAISFVRRMGGLRPGAMPSLRWSFFAGEALRADDATAWQEAADRSTLENIYGPTELTVTVTGHRWSPQDSPQACVNGLVPIGAVHEGHDHLLLDERDEPADHEGELCITGPQMTSGYLDPADDEGRFLERDARTWYRTGDRVRRIGNGELIYLGRLDSQVQVQGWRVELPEIEHALRGCEGVDGAVTVTRQGDNGTELVVFYTGVRTAPARLAHRLREILPKGMLPREYRHLEAFPLNSNRKVDRKQLAEDAAKPPVAAASSGQG